MGLKNCDPSHVASFLENSRLIPLIGPPEQIVSLLHGLASAAGRPHSFFARSTPACRRKLHPEIGRGWTSSGGRPARKPCSGGDDNTSISRRTRAADSRSAAQDGRAASHTL